MVCLGVIFGCKLSSFESFVITGSVIAGIIVTIRLICYIVYRLMLNRSSATDDDIAGHTSSDSDSGLEMQPQNQVITINQNSR